MGRTSPIHTESSLPPWFLPSFSCHSSACRPSGPSAHVARLGSVPQLACTSQEFRLADLLQLIQNPGAGGSSGLFPPCRDSRVQVISRLRLSTSTHALEGEARAWGKHFDPYMLDLRHNGSPHLYWPELVSGLTCLHEEGRSLRLK